MAKWWTFFCLFVFGMLSSLHISLFLSSFIYIFDEYIWSSPVVHQGNEMIYNWWSMLNRKEEKVRNVCTFWSLWCILISSMFITKNCNQTKERKNWIYKNQSSPADKLYFFGVCVCLYSYQISNSSSSSSPSTTIAAFEIGVFIIIIISFIKVFVYTINFNRTRTTTTRKIIAKGTWSSN